MILIIVSIEILYAKHVKEKKKERKKKKRKKRRKKKKEKKDVKKKYFSIVVMLQNAVCVFSASHDVLISPNDI